MQWIRVLDLVCLDVLMALAGGVWGARLSIVISIYCLGVSRIEEEKNYKQSPAQHCFSCGCVDYYLVVTFNPAIERRPVCGSVFIFTTGSPTCQLQLRCSK